MTTSIPSRCRPRGEPGIRIYLDKEADGPSSTDDLFEFLDTPSKPRSVDAWHVIDLQANTLSWSSQAPPVATFPPRRAASLDGASNGLVPPRADGPSSVDVDLGQLGATTGTPWR